MAFRLYQVFFPGKALRKLTIIRRVQNSPQTKKTETPFLLLGASCLKTGKATISKINTKLYFVPLIFVLKIQKDPSTRANYCAKSVGWRQDHNIIPPRKFAFFFRFIKFLFQLPVTVKWWSIRSCMINGFATWIDDFTGKIFNQLLKFAWI